MRQDDAIVLQLQQQQVALLRINQSIISLLTYDKTHMLTLNTELQYKKSQYESLYSMRIKNDTRWTVTAQMYGYFSLRVSASGHLPPPVTVSGLRLG